jgi:hypothetical protein
MMIITSTECIVYDEHHTMFEKFVATKSKSEQTRDMFLRYLNSVDDWDYIHSQLARHSLNCAVIDQAYKAL